MVDAAMKHMASNFFKLDKFEGVDFGRWQKKMHFLLSSMSVVYVLTTPILEDGENATMKQIRMRNKWDNDDYVCRGLILNGGIECIFVGYVEHSKAFRFYVIEHNELVLINYIIKSMDAIFDENRFLSVPRPSQRSLINGIEDTGGLVVPEEATKEDDPKTFDEAMKSQDVATGKKQSMMR
ncbi:hypothetical protein Tco_1428546 [Tanacetum coccineum]